MASSSIRPLPHLPLETQAAILRFCDPPTLAVSSRVCLAWLELAGPILYEHISIRGQEQLEMMIRSKSVLASVGSFLSLEQTRTFTYVVLDARDSLADISRRFQSSPAHVDELKIDFREDTLASVNQPARLDVLVASFDLTHLHLLARPKPMIPTTVYYAFPQELAWSQLRQISFESSLADSALFQVAAVANRSPRVDLVYDLASHVSMADVKETLDCVLEDLSLGEEGREGPAFGRVQVWVPNREEVEIANKMLVDCSCASLDIGLKSPADAC